MKKIVVYHFTGWNSKTTIEAVFEIGNADYAEKLKEQYEKDTGDKYFVNYMDEETIRSLMFPTQEQIDEEYDAYCAWAD